MVCSGLELVSLTFCPTAIVDAVNKAMFKMDEELAYNVMNADLIKKLNQGDEVNECLGSS